MWMKNCEVVLKQFLLEIWMHTTPIEEDVEWTIMVA